MSNVKTETDAVSGYCHGSSGAVPGPILKLAFVPTAKGMRAFNIKFRAALPKELQRALVKALTLNELNPEDCDEAAKHADIYDMLITTMSGHDSILLDMTDECGMLCPRCIVWLMD